MMDYQYNNKAVVTSFGYFSYYAFLETFDDIMLTSMYINVKDPSDEQFLNQFQLQMYKQAGISLDSNLKQENQSVGVVRATFIVNVLFDSIIGVTMFLCFFALSANMSANIFEQAKEIGVIRSLGYRSGRIMALYFYEALVLVLSSSVMGVIIGVVVGITMTLQQTLLL